MRLIQKYTRILVYTFAVASLVVMGGCKSKKTTLIETSGTLKSKLHNEIVEDILAHELNYKTITTKGKIKILKGSSEKEVTTVFKIVKDEVLQASVRPFMGVEMMKLELTPDSIIILDRLKKRYAAESISQSDIKQLVAFNFYNLQALLTNQLFVPGLKKVDESDYKRFNIAAAEDVYVLQTQDKNKLKYNFAVDASDRIISTLIHSKEHKLDVHWTYSQFVVDKEFIYPTEMVANITFDKKKFGVGISYSSLDVNTDFHLDRSIPSSYKKVELLDLINAYIKVK